MAKPPETRDRFQISAQASTERVGELLATLVKMGFENIGYEVITDVSTFKRNGAKRPAPDAAPAPARADDGISAKDFVAAYLADHPSFHISELVNAFKGRGWSGNNAYKIARDLAEAGILRKLDQSNYARADIKALAPPKAPAAAPKPAPKPGSAPKKSREGVAKYDVSNRDLMLLAVGKRKIVTIAEMRAHLAGEGRPQKSASPMLFKMTQDGLFKRTGTEGEYAVTDKGQKEARNVRDRDHARRKKAATEASIPATEVTDA